MIVPDINLLVYAYNSDAPEHRSAREWWERCLSGNRSVGLPWAAALGFTRIMTSRAVLLRPIAPGIALGHVRDWLDRPNARVLEPGPRHLGLLEDLLDRSGASGRLLTDAHLAALAIENQAELHSNDTDFGRFPGLRWVNPLS